MRSRGRQIGANLFPEEQSTRWDPMIGYFVDTYWGLSGDAQAAAELSDMMRAGVPLTRELVDFVAGKHGLDTMRAFMAENGTGESPAVPLAQWVYFIRVQDRVKIGTSVNPAKRAASLSLRVKDVYAVIEGGRVLEQHLHERFAEHRIDDTEWFAWVDDIAEFVERYTDRFTKDHRAYTPGASAQSRMGYGALARALDIGG